MTFDKFQTTYKIQLNTQQSEAVQSIAGPVLLLAVPGSGKTTVLVTRLGYMIYGLGIAPESILTVTYTVAATRDMADRFSRLFGEEAAYRLEFRTINGICAKIIARYGQLVGKNAFELMTDEKYIAGLVAAIFRESTRGIPTESDIKQVRTLITYIKNRMLNTREIEALGEETDLPLLQMYQSYVSQMREKSYMDYDDQMVYAYTILRKSPEMLEYMQNQYQYICVDEAQDTSKIQHMIIACLAGKNKNLFMVGDEDQSIYGFRAAYPEALLSFERDHPGAKVLLMEENFRSVGKIVEAADGFIQKNQLRHPKHMKATREAGNELHEIHVKSRRAQYQYLAKVAQSCSEQTAVLYRDHESVLPLVDLLERQQIPFQMKNADLTFFTHRIVQDLGNIVRFAENPIDTELFMQIYYKIGTYLNKNAALEACRISRRDHIPVLEAAYEWVDIPPGTLKSCKSMETHLKGLLNEPADKAIYRIVHFMGYENFLERSNIKDTKIEILKAMAENEPDMHAFMQRLLVLAELLRNKKPDRSCPFILSTIHSSKGLEYDTVFMMDVCDGIFPENVVVDRRFADADEIREYEEERRLFYVGATRAKNDLHIFTFPMAATFSRELLGKVGKLTVHQNHSSKKSVTPMPKTDYGTRCSKKKLTQEDYINTMTTIVRRGVVNHSMYGEGTLLEVKGDYITAKFGTTTKTFSLKVLMEKNLLMKEMR